MKIFIGTSGSHLYGDKNKSTYNLPTGERDKLIREENSIAYQLSEKLKKLNYDVAPWWESIKQEDFLNKIIKLTHECDFGIFVLDEKGKDSIDNQLGFTNENVLIELGMFIAIKRNNDAIFYMRDKNINNPADLSKINNVPYELDNKDEKNINQIFNELIGKIKKININKKQNQLANVLMNMSSINKWISNPHQDNSINKNIYLGFTAAKLWADVEERDNYIPRDFYQEFSRNLINLWKNKDINNISNIVSLGCGVGKVDDKFMKTLPRNSTVLYMPIDINPFHVTRAIQNISSAKITKTYGIVDDFETEINNLKFTIQDILKDGITIYTLLGGTFCNLDNPEEFLIDWSEEINEEDYFLLDVVIYNENYKKDKDKEMSQHLNPFLQNVVRHQCVHEKKCMDTTNIKFDSIPEVDIYDTVILKWKEEGQDNTLFTARRYKESYIRNEIEEYFKIVDNFSININTRPGLQKIHYLLQRK